jgi:hypothetical protein
MRSPNPAAPSTPTVKPECNFDPSCSITLMNLYVVKYTCNYRYACMSHHVRLQDFDHLIISDMGSGLRTRSSLAPFTIALALAYTNFYQSPSAPRLAFPINQDRSEKAAPTSGDHRVEFPARCPR